MGEVTARHEYTLPVGSAGERSGGWWGCLTLIVTEGSLFGYLIFSYLYLAAQTGQQWPPEGLPKLGLGILNGMPGMPGNASGEPALLDGFLARVGAMSSTLFVFALIVTDIAVLIVPPCRW